MCRTHRDLDNTKDGKEFSNVFGTFARRQMKKKKQKIDFVDRIDEQSMANCVSATIVLTQSELKWMKKKHTHANLVPLILLFAGIFQSELFKYMVSRRVA